MVIFAGSEKQDSGRMAAAEFSFEFESAESADSAGFTQDAAVN